MNSETNQTKGEDTPPSLARRIGRQVRDWAGFFVVLAVLMHVVGQWRAPDLPEMAPDFVLTDLDGQSVQLSQLRGRPVVLNFWATWCGPCTFEIPSFSTFADGHPTVAVLGIAVDGTPAELKKAAQDLGVTYPVLVGRKDVQRAYGVSTLPTTVVVAPDGRVHTAHTGLMFGPQLAWAVRAWD